MFTPKRPSALSGSNSAKVTRSQSLKTKNEFSPSVNLAGTTPAGALNRISLTMSSIYNDSILESYKAPLPIRVNELIFQLKSKDSIQLNATILSNGHVCLVNDKKLYVWKLKKSFKNIQSNELSVPNSKNLLKSNCVSIECHNNKDYVGICVTVEGYIRYWPSIFNEYLCVDTKFDLHQGDEVSNLIYIHENFYLIVTANGNLWSIMIENVDGKTTPICRQIDMSSGFISSVSRRMTTLIFGGGGSGTGFNRNTQNLKSVVRYKISSELFLLVDKNVQKWKINSDNTLTMLMQTNFEKLFYEEYINQNVNSVRIGINFQDMSITKNSLYILAIIEDDGHKFCIAEVDTYRTNEMKIKAFHILNYQVNILDTQINGNFKLHAMDNQHAFYIHNSNSVISFTGPTLELTGESKFNTLGDKIIASNFYDHDLIFFSLNHGILKTKDHSLRLSIDEEGILSMNEGNQSIDGSYLRQNFANNTQFNDISNLSIQSMDDTSFNFKGARQSFDFTFSNMASTDHLMFNRLKEAFQCYLKKEERESQSLLEEIFELEGMDKKLDFLSVELSEKLIDDMPAHDPRWAELSATKSKSFNTNLIISNQLKGKIKLHEYYLTFLKKFQLWNRLTSVNYNGRDILTINALEEHGEKLQLALIIREQLYSKNPEFINQAIELTTKNREDLNSKLIYPHDVFYRRVSKIDELFNSLFLVENEVIKVNSNEQAINYIIDTTNFFNKLLKTSQFYRQEKTKLYEIQDEEYLELIRWTFLPIKELTNTVPSIMNICIKQHKLCSEYGLSNCNTLENKSIILQSLFELDSLIFEEYNFRLNSIDKINNESDYVNFKLSYDSLKSKLNEAFIKHKQIENAIKLAEKYVDFNTLVVLCEIKSDNDLLESYLDKFYDSNFAEFVVKHFMEKRKLNFLLRDQFLKRMDISKCLDKYQFLSWIKDFKNSKYIEAARTLENLGVNENDSFMKQKTLISMSKLSLIANNSNLLDFEQKMIILNRQLDYLSYIEYIAPNINKNYGLALDQIKTYKPEELINIYINDEKSTEIEFKKAFELIHFLNDDKTTFYTQQQMERLKIEIFVRSILADNWEKLYDQDYPESQLNESKFFKTIYLIKQSGENFDSILSLKDEIINHELLEHLAKNTKFSYLLQACLELASY